ncbi:hypothetical protein [Sorangium sp. So ce1078]|uniref:hypothetical protein n=1 Tax=Sorangium sp. So ce1078 TaxID=3133329 RepID=UPI003F6410BF
MRRQRSTTITPFIVFLVLLAAPATALASHITNKSEVRSSLESDGWTVAYGKELDQWQQARCVVEIAAAAIISGGTAAVLAGAECLRDAAVESVKELPENLVKQALGNLGQVFSSDGLEVQANIATYNHKECLDFWPNTCVATPNTWQAYIRFRGRSSSGGAPAGPDYETIVLKNECYKHGDIWTAIHYQKLDGSWASDGFWKLSPGQTATVAHTRNVVYYVWARSVDSTVFWAGDKGPWAVRGDPLKFIEVRANWGSWGTWTHGFRCD